MMRTTCQPLPTRSRVAVFVPRLALACAAMLFFSGGVRSAEAQGRCGAGVDLVVQALEKMRADSSASELGDANQLLKRASELCGELGDAWYYRSLVERKLGHASVADFAMRQAKQFPSDASAEQANPFVLASPLLRAAGGRRGIDGTGTPSAGTPGHPADRWALIVGIGSFADKNIEPLHYTQSDAQSFQDALLDPKIGHFKAANVHSLMNDQATRKNIMIQLNWLARSAGPDDMVVVYVATHGSSRDVDTADVNYIITHDTEIGPGQNPDPDTLYATALPMVDISNAIATRVKARRAAIFLDTCYSGNAASKNVKLIAPGIANSSPSAATLDHIKQGAGRMVFAASGTEQESLESEALKHGLFTYFLVEALRTQGGSAPLSKIFDYTQKHVAERAASEFRQYHLQQNPVMSRSEDDTDFALGPAAGAAAGGGE
jgi:Caspase domain